MKILVVSPESVRAAVSFLQQAEDLIDEDDPKEELSLSEIAEVFSQMRHAKRLIEHAMLELTSEEVQGG